MSNECFSGYVSHDTAIGQRISTILFPGASSFSRINILAAPTFKVGLTADEKKLYSHLFKTLDPENTGIITGEKARSTFEKSGLPPAILGEIWQIADQNNLGFLTQFGFCHAMRLIGHTQAGNHPSAVLAENPGPLPKFANLGLPVQTQLQPQSTNSSFMQSQPSSVVPQNTATLQSEPQEPITAISPADFQKFSHLFTKTVGSPSGELSGNQARDIFLKAKLPTSTLGQIWSLVDVNNLGKLNLSSFVIAMHLVQGLLSGQIKQLPPFLPENVVKSVQDIQVQTFSQQRSVGSRQASHNSISSQLTTLRHPSSGPQLSQRDASSGSISNAGSSEWIATPIMKQQYESIFNNLDKSRNGQLNPDQVANFLMTSKLNQKDLATVWDLSDIQNTGIFTKLEFSIALFLVNKKLTGGNLPNIVPGELIESLKSSPDHLQAPQSSSAPPQEKMPAAPQRQPTAMDDLVDIFGTSESTPIATPTRGSAKPELQSRSSSSDLAMPGDLPKVRSNLTGSFKPTSTFGQSLMHKQTGSPASSRTDDNLLGEDLHLDQGRIQPQPSPLPVTSPAPTPIEKEQKSVNYDALRSVPPPPPKKTGTESAPLPETMSPVYSGQHQQSAQPESRDIPQYQHTPPPSQFQRQYYNQPQNNDLLADSNPEISGQLSQATSDIANVSNHIKSLSAQTTELDEKKSRAEQELQKILSIKKDIEIKLKQLRSSYENEVKQVDQVEANLASAKEETEALRSEASISEAKFNSLSTELNTKQVAMEDLQKQNFQLKERLGFLNAEIVELEKQVEIKNGENQSLSNQVSVKNSQVQVVLVKTQELKSKLAELHESNTQYESEIANADQHQLSLEKERSSLEQEISHLSEQVKAHKSKIESQKSVIDSHQAAIKNQKSVIDGHKSTLSKSELATGAGIGAVIGGIAGVVGHHLGSKDSGEPTEEPAKETEETEETPIKGLETKEVAPVEPKEDALPSFTTSNIAGLVDEVQEVPSADFTGLEDEVIDREDSQKEIISGEGIDYSQDEEEINRRFPDYSVGEATDNVTNATSSVATEYKHDDSETPVTSPSTSEYQFGQTNAGIAGGMVGMPGVLVGVQRTDSLTSSVQNNAALSVRDDNIDDISDRETLENEAIVESEIPKSATTDASAGSTSRHQEDSSDGDKSSSGVESFELVQAEDARSQEAKLEGDAVQSVSVKNVLSTEQSENEFPPIKELDYDESSSSSEEESQEDQYDDAVDDLPQSSSKPDDTIPQSTKEKAVIAPPAPKFDEFDNAFDDLEPARPEAQQTDLFADEFDNLESAQVDETVDDNFDQQQNFGFSDFTEEPYQQTNDQTQAVHANFPDFSGASQDEPSTGNDEWEQLFAGFGNATTETELPQIPTYEQSTGALKPSHEHAIQELVGMGFDKSTATQALEREEWDLEAATNYLLDNT